MTTQYEQTIGDCPKSKDKENPVYYDDGKDSRGDDYNYAPGFYIYDGEADCPRGDPFIFCPWCGKKI